MFNDQHEELANSTIEQLAKMNCASLIVVTPFYDDETFFRVKTADDSYGKHDIENLINATEHVLELLKQQLNKQAGGEWMIQ